MIEVSAIMILILECLAVGVLLGYALGYVNGSSVGISEGDINKAFEKKKQEYREWKEVQDEIYQKEKK